MIYKLVGIQSGQFAIQPEVKKTTRLVTNLVEALWNSKQAVAKANRQASLSLCSWRDYRICVNPATVWEGMARSTIQDCRG
ncbi:MAG: hypothetical protein JXB88_15990 [Spirochaetales bacterium]|nr:hypothetical protein [Spirochaetales bacterium]